MKRAKVTAVYDDGRRKKRSKEEHEYNVRTARTNARARKYGFRGSRMNAAYDPQMEIRQQEDEVTILEVNSLHSYKTDAISVSSKPKNVFPRETGSLFKDAIEAEAKMIMSGSFMEHWSYEEEWMWSESAVGLAAAVGKDCWPYWEKELINDAGVNIINHDDEAWDDIWNLKGI